MNFSEKLTKLRKENNMSQESLAEVLEVSRQSVSKWESGINYPEMDKLLSMCKIFNVTLEELTNDNLKLGENKSKDKNYFDLLVGEITYIIDKTYYMFKNLRRGKKSKVIGELIILFFILLIFKIPFNYIIHLGDNLFYSFNSNISYILSSFWAFFINLIYVALFIITFLYIYKKYYLDKFEEVEVINESINEENTKEVIKEKVVYKNSTNVGSTIFNAITTIVSFCIKVFLVFMIIPIIIMFIFLAVALFVLISALFKGIVYFGFILCTLGGLLLLGLFIDLIVSFLFNKKPKINLMIIIFLSGLCVLGFGIGLSIIEVSKTEYIDEAPKLNLEKETTTYEFDVNDNLLMHPPYNLGFTDYIEDNTLGDKVIVEVNYYKHIHDVNIITNNTLEGKYKAVNFYYNSHYNKELLDNFLKDLKDKKIYNYSKLSENMITIKASKESIEKMEKVQEEYISDSNIDTYNYYSNQILKLENEKELLNQKIYELEEENDELKNSLQEYKDRIKELAE